MIKEDFIATIDTWIDDLDHYDFGQLCTQPTINSWSIGQVYIHLIEATEYFFEQIPICLSSDDNADKEMSPKAKSMFESNEFPNMMIEGPKSNDDTCQPYSRDEILSSFEVMKASVIDMDKLISNGPFNGKTKHPGLGYFSAMEWFQFAEMHFRHHLRQKSRVEAFLNL